MASRRGQMGGRYNRMFIDVALMKFIRSRRNMVDLSTSLLYCMRHLQYLDDLSAMMRIMTLIYPFFIIIRASSLHKNMWIIITNIIIHSRIT